MRTLTTHIVEGDSANHQIEIAVLDEPGHGGACHLYRVDGGRCMVGFQNGPIKEYGVNGITHEALLAILIDRMEGDPVRPLRQRRQRHGPGSPSRRPFRPSEPHPRAPCPRR